MSSEVCPFCGKTYKRLKSHLPHCKAAASSKAPPIKHDVTANQTASSSQLVTASTEEGKSTETLSMAASPQSKKSKRVSVVSPTPQTPLPSADTSSLSLSSASPPPSTKRKKKKLSEQIKTATMPIIISTTTQPPSLSATISKPKKKSLRALIEAANTKQVTEGPVEAGPLSPRTITQTETRTNPDKDNAHPAFLPTDAKTKGVSKMKVSKAKKAAQQSLSANEDTSSSLDSKVNERPHVRNDFLLQNLGEAEDVSVDKMFLKSGRGHQARITLQDVKAALGRADTTRQSGRPGILSQIRTAEIRPGARLSPLPTGNQGDADSRLVTTETAQSVIKKTSKSKQTSLIPLQHDGFPPELNSPAAPLPSEHLSSQTKSTVGLNEGPKVGHHRPGLPLTQFPSPRVFPLAPQILPARVETSRADDGWVTERSQLEIRKQNAAENGPKERSLGQVRLRELPDWLVYKAPTHPREVVEMVQRGWRWYYRRYIDVRKGGVGGLGMLLAGYCVLSYIWSYPHIKLDRWRKHH